MRFSRRVAVTIAALVVPAAAGVWWISYHEPGGTVAGLVGAVRQTAIDPDKSVTWGVE